MTRLPLPYIHRFTTGGHTYVYFHRDSKRWRLPGAPSSPEFVAEYNRLLAITGPEKPEPNIESGLVRHRSSIATKAELLAAAVKFKDFGCGIYFLIKEGEVVYVGQSTNVFARVPKHRKDKEFDSWHWVPCERKNLNGMELFYLGMFKPTLNKDYLTERMKALAKFENDEIWDE